MKKNTLAVRAIGTVLVVVFVLSSIMAFTAIGVSAATVAPQIQSDKTTQGISVAAPDGAGYDWWYPWNWKHEYHPVV